MKPSLFSTFDDLKSIRQIRWDVFMGKSASKRKRRMSVQGLSRESLAIQKYMTSRIDVKLASLKRDYYTDLLINAVMSTPVEKLRVSPSQLYKLAVVYAEQVFRMGGKINAKALKFFYRKVRTNTMSVRDMNQFKKIYMATKKRTDLISKKLTQILTERYRRANRSDLGTESINLVWPYTYFLLTHEPRSQVPRIRKNVIVERAFNYHITQLLKTANRSVPKTIEVDVSDIRTYPKWDDRIKDVAKSMAIMEFLQESGQSGNINRNNNSERQIDELLNYVTSRVNVSEQSYIYQDLPTYIGRIVDEITRFGVGVVRGAKIVGKNVATNRSRNAPGGESVRNNRGRNNNRNTGPNGRSRTNGTNNRNAARQNDRTNGNNTNNQTNQNNRGNRGNRVDRNDNITNSQRQTLEEITAALENRMRGIGGDSNSSNADEKMARLKKILESGNRSRIMRHVKREEVSRLVNNVAPELQDLINNGNYNSAINIVEKHQRKIRKLNKKYDGRKKRRSIFSKRNDGDGSSRTGGRVLSLRKFTLEEPNEEWVRRTHRGNSD
jgi:hypothetical protein